MVRGACIALVLASGLSAPPEAGQRADTGTPAVALSSEGRRQVEHAAEDPLLLTVSIFNGLADHVRMENLDKHERLEALIGSEWFRDLSEEQRERLRAEHAPREIPIFTLGSPQRRLATLVRFTVLDASGASVPLAVRPLAAGLTIDAVTLDGEETAFLWYGIEAEALAALTEGTYAIRAHLETEDAPDMWQGRVTSPPLTVHLTSTAPDASAEATARRLVLTGSYYLRDRQFVPAEATAHRLLKLDPRSIRATVLLGDALAGRGLAREALEVFWKALDLFNEEAQRAGIDEPPEYILGRIEQLQQALR